MVVAIFILELYALSRLPEKCKKAQSIQNSLKELGLVGLTDLASGAVDCTVTDVTNITLQR